MPRKCPAGPGRIPFLYGEWLLSPVVLGEGKELDVTSSFATSLTTLLGPDPRSGLTQAGERQTVTNVSPLSGKELPAMPLGTAEDVEKAFVKARAAQRTWGEAPVTERAEIIGNVARKVRAYEKELLDIIQEENGKVRAHAFEEVTDVAMTASWLAKNAPKILKEAKVEGVMPLLSSVRINHHPLGVVAVISPWNYPFTLAISDALAALVAGNAIVLKPDSKTVLSALAAKKVLTEAGLDPDLLQIVAGPGSKLGAELISRADYLMFTGSTATGRIVAAQAGEALIGCSAELGGKNPLLVLGDAPISRAVKGAVKATTSNSGQLCISIERIYVVDSVWDEFVPAYVKAMKKVRVEASHSWKAGMGPLISTDQFNTVSEHVNDAVGKGATVLAGGHALPKVGPTAYAPTVLTDVTEDMIVCRTETFGPVVSLYRVSSDEEAIRKANDTDYGLNASIWTDPARGAELGARVEAGTVNINDGYIAAWAAYDAPMGGFGISGLGRRHGVNGILKYTEPQTVAIQRVQSVAPPAGVSEKAWARVMRLFGRYFK